MKRILSFGLVSLLVAILAMVTLGCVETAGRGWIEEESGNTVMFGGRLKPLGIMVKIDPIPWDLELAEGSLQIVDSSQNIIIQGQSKLIRGDNSTANFYLFDLVDQEGNITYYLSAVGCTVNGKGEYNVVAHHTTIAEGIRVQIYVLNENKVTVYSWDGIYQRGRFLNY